jgi:hypothetical protein
MIFSNDQTAFYPIKGNPKVARYIDLAKFASMLHKQKLFFSRVDKLSDKFEGRYAENQDFILRSYFNYFKQQVGYADLDVEEKVREKKEFANTLRSIICINCWHKSDQENGLMWIAYGGYDKGIMIKSTYEKLHLSLNDNNLTPHRLYISNVVYGFNFISPENSNYSFLQKHPSFSSENELRIVCDLSYNSKLFDIKNWNYDWSKEESESGIYVPVKLDTLIDEIIVAPNAENWYHDLVCSLNEVYGLNKPIKWSELKG